MASGRPTDTRIASEPQRFLLGLVDCNPILKNGLDPLCNAWVPRDCSLKEKQHPFKVLAFPRKGATEASRMDSERARFSDEMH
jgi:hypothetical protein